VPTTGTPEGRPISSLSRGSAGPGRKRSTSTPLWEAELLGRHPLEPVADEDHAVEPPGQARQEFRRPLLAQEPQAVNSQDHGHADEPRGQGRVGGGLDVVGVDESEALAADQAGDAQEQAQVERAALGDHVDGFPRGLEFLVEILLAEARDGGAEPLGVETARQFHHEGLGARAGQNVHELEHRLIRNDRHAHCSRHRSPRSREDHLCGGP